MRPSVQQPISKDKNVMVQTRKYYLKNHYLTLKSKVLVCLACFSPSGHVRMLCLSCKVKISKTIAKLYLQGQKPASLKIIFNGIISHVRVMLLSRPRYATLTSALYCSHVRVLLLSRLRYTTLTSVSIENYF
jgi:hypothetical protein